jgi:hypothetical protein
VVKCCFGASDVCVYIVHTIFSGSIPICDAIRTSSSVTNHDRHIPQTKRLEGRPLQLMEKEAALVE